MIFAAHTTSLVLIVNKLEEKLHYNLVARICNPSEIDFPV